MPPKRWWKWSKRERRPAATDDLIDLSNSLSPPDTANDGELALDSQLPAVHADANNDSAIYLDISDEERDAAALQAASIKLAKELQAVEDAAAQGFLQAQEEEDALYNQHPVDAKMPAAAAAPAPAARPPMILSEMGYMIPAPYSSQFPDNCGPITAATARKSGSKSGSESDNSLKEDDNWGATSPLYSDGNNQNSGVSNLKTEEGTSARNATSRDPLVGTILEDIAMASGNLPSLGHRELPNSAGTSGRGKKHRPTSRGSHKSDNSIASGIGSAISIVSSGVASVKSGVASVISISSSSVATSTKCAFSLPSFTSKEKKEMEEFFRDVANLQAIADYGISHAKNLNYDASKLISITHGENVMRVLIFESDKQLLLDAMQKDFNFCRYVKNLRGSRDEHKLHSPRIENDIYFELAQLLAPTDVKTNWRLEIILKCPKDEELANGENIETGGSNDEVARNQCASVVAETHVDGNLAFSPIKRGSGTIGSYSNARNKCIKDTGPGKCGCKDWQDDEVKRAKHYLETKARYYRSQKIPVAAICFGGTSAKKVMDELDSRLFDSINCEAYPHLCTLVCAYGYKGDYSFQLRSIFGKVGSISSTLEGFWDIVERRYPSFERPTKTMIDALVATDELPMVNEDTPANVKKAKNENSKRISKLMKRLWNNAEWRKRWYEKRWGKNRKKKLKKVFTDNWKNPEWVANWKAARWSDAQRADKSDLMKAQFQDPEWVANWKAARWSDAQRAEQSEKLKSVSKASGYTSIGGQSYKEALDTKYNRESNTPFVCLRCAKGKVLATQKFAVNGTHTSGLLKGRPKVGNKEGTGYCEGCKKQHVLWAAVKGDSDEADIDAKKIPNSVQSIIRDNMCSEDNCFNVRYRGKKMCQPHYKSHK
jgi:hypothetical protein